MAVSGVATAGDGYRHTSGAQILDAAGNPVRIAGINWYGFETTDEVVHGLWGQDYKTIVGAVKSFGYNTIRIPFSDQMVEGSKVANQISFFGQNGPVNTDLRGLTSMQNGSWYTSAYPESVWISDRVALANRYKGN